MTYCYLGNSTKCSSPIPSSPRHPPASPSSPTPIFRVSHSPCTSLCTPPRRFPCLPFFFLLFFARAPFLFCFLVRCTLCSTGRAASLQRDSVGVATAYEQTKTSSPSVVASVRCTRVSIYRRSPAIASMPNAKREDHVDSRILSWKRVVQGFVSQLCSAVSNDVDASGGRL